MKQNRKTFLTQDPSETGSICWHVNSNPEIDIYDIEAEVKFYDCSRSVVLDFHCYERKDIANRIEKANTLLKEITEFRDALVACNTKPKLYY